MLYYGVVERWINLDFSKEKVYNNSSENGDMSNKKEGFILFILINCGYLD